MSESWNCVACYAANAATASRCGICGRSLAAEPVGEWAGSFGMTAAERAAAVRPPRPPVDEPAAATATIQRRPVTRPRRSRGKWVSRLVVIALIGFGAFATRHFWLDPLHSEPSQDSLQTTATPNSGITPSNPPCPATIADTIPAGGGAGATLVETHQTSGYTITICNSFGKLFYYGVSITNPSLSITLPAQKSGSGFIATNHAFTYHVGTQGLVVTEEGQTDPVVSQMFIS
ncbi:MAG TPA: hypothetical protein VH372_07925 [Actinospica sp.]|jgi:hypothetical protein|nr:hypothetical protein [Actinospica sp.]